MANEEYQIIDLNEEIRENSLAEAVNSELLRINDTFNAPLIKKIPITEVAGLGAVFSSFLPKAVEVAGTVAENGGLFRCVFPKGVTGHLAQTGGQYIGGILTTEGSFAQARWVPVAAGAKGGASAAAVSQPVVILVAVAIIGIGMKINEIKKGQEKIIGILERDKKSQLIADYEILQDLLEDYRYYFENETTMTVNLNQVKNIKRNALKDLKSYQEELENIIDSKKSIMKMVSATADIKEIFDRFVHYKLAINVYAMASYMDIMLARNFQEEYLEKEIEALKSVAESYEKIYCSCYDKLGELRKTSISSKAVKGLAWLSKGAGKVINSIPIVDGEKVEEKLVEGSDKLEAFDEKMLNDMLSFFEEYRACGATPIVEHVENLNMISNKKTEMLCDGKVIYMFSEKTA